MSCVRAQRNTSENLVVDEQMLRVLSLRTRDRPALSVRHVQETLFVLIDDHVPPMPVPAAYGSHHLALLDLPAPSQAHSSDTPVSVTRLGSLRAHNHPLVNPRASSVLADRPT